ncbi:ankyrin repeat domain-containing protein [Streptomyces sp. MAR4 CNX-425]|uniref:ankyrin repeat domain-containing protein n=1 Tax=Streptomyces sp. MAR4 CNX-425 TaxID=3406343 RepID=UPI003B50848C
MGFFDDLVLPEEPAAERAELIRLVPPGEEAGTYAPPVDWYAPALLPQLATAGTGPQVRVVVTGWSVWPRTATLHLAVFRRTRRQEGDAGRQSGLRVGMLFSDGRRVTSLDGKVPRLVRYTTPQGEQVDAATEQATGLIPLDPGLQPSRRSLFKTDVDLYLPELPPTGETQLVVEWPDEAVAETRTAVDAAALHAAAGAALEVWPGLGPVDHTGPAGTFASVEIGGPPRLLAPPLTHHQRRALRRQEEERRRHVPRADWEGVRWQDWSDAEVIRARLDGGAPPDTVAGSDGATPLHLAAERGSGEAVAALLPHVTQVDPHDDDGHTPLWFAACSVDEGSVRALLDAGADAWTPQLGPWSPGRLLLTTPLARLVADLPGAVSPPAEEAAAFQEADALIAAFGEREMWIEGLGIAFVRDLDEDEVIRRLSADPARCPRAAPEEAPFDPLDHEESLRFVGVTGVPGEPGGCVITQEGYMPGDNTVLRAISRETSAYGIYYNPKGGTFGVLARDGEIADHEEIGLRPGEEDPPSHWHFRFWQRGDAFPYGADTLAYGCAAAGLKISDGRQAADHRTPRRWVALPPELRR